MKITDILTSLVLDPSVSGGSSVTGFEVVMILQKIYLKINDEILKGTLSGLNVTSITRGQGSTTVQVTLMTSVVELYQINKTPLTEINKVHTSLINIGINSYTVSLTTTPTVSGSSDTTEVGGSSVYVSENYRYETMKNSLIQTLELTDTRIEIQLGSTSGTSPSGTETSFSKLDTDKEDIILNENTDLDKTNINISDKRTE